ncbi:MAG TPA: hypothetical protein EYP90_10260 [Chromatiaceae bacterium]|nr:hypothetical protein [Chromatiaceae bacterium]
MVGAGDVVALSGDGDPALYRVDIVEQSGLQLIEAVRVEPGVYMSGDAIEDTPRSAPFTPAVPVFPVFMDLPLIAETDAPHAPYLAVGAKPWPGSVALYSAPSDSGYGLNTLISAPATIGQTENALFAANSGRRDNGVALRVRLSQGALSSASWADVLNGANFAAIGDGSSDNWELFQYETATLVGAGTYDLSGRLRGQFGTDAIMPAAWPIGSLFARLDGIPEQISLPSAARDLARHYRVGPATRPNGDPSYVHLVEAFKGVGLRPYSPVHLGMMQGSGGEATFRWVRRTRIDGDSWSGLDVPLGEGAELYLVRVVVGGTILRETTVTQPEWTYSQPMQTSDGISGTYELSVAQVSDRFGPGPFTSITVAG